MVNLSKSKFPYPLGISSHTINREPLSPCSELPKETRLVPYSLSKTRGGWGKGEYGPRAFCIRGGIRSSNKGVDTDGLCSGHAGNGRDEQRCALR